MLRASDVRIMPPVTDPSSALGKSWRHSLRVETREQAKKPRPWLMGHPLLTRVNGPSFGCWLPPGAWPVASTAGNGPRATPLVRISATPLPLRLRLPLAIFMPLPLIMPRT